MTHPISTAEFHHQLQSGQIHSALLLVLQDPTLLDTVFNHELDVTTNTMSADRDPDRAVNNGYLRTKINLLTGEIQNEVSQNLLLDRASYSNLQQLHTDRLIASYGIVSGHLDRIESILAALLSPTVVQRQAEANGSAAVEDREKVTAALLQARLTESLTMLPATNNRPHKHGGVTNNDDVTEPSDLAVAPDETAPTQLEIGEFDEIDLAIQDDDEIWEEWVEDDDFQPESVLPQPTIVPEDIQLPEFQEHWVRRPLSPIDVKPIVPRSTPGSIDPAERWEKFVPEYIDIDSANPDRSQPTPQIDLTRAERLLANLVGDNP